MSGSPFSTDQLPVPNALIPKASDPGFTNFKLQFNNWYKAGEPISRTGPMRSTPIPFRVVPNVQAQVIACMNPFRKGLMIQNKDDTNILYVGFGSLADINSFEVQPNQTVLLDFVCPTDAISVFSTVALSGFLVEMAQSAE